MSGSLGRTTAIGVGWLMMQTVGTRLVGFAAQLVIASILDPVDFGLIGLAYTISNIGSALVAFGLDQIVIQRQRTLRFWILPAFYMSLALGLAGCLVLIAVAPICAAIYGEPRVTPLVDLIAIGMPLSALGTVPTILLRARLAFGTIATINFGETVTTQALTIALALMGFGAFSFAIPSPTVALLKSACLWLAAPASLRGSWRKVRRGRFLLGSSAAVFLSSLLQTLVGNGDYIILGLLASASEVGNYFFAFKLASQPLLMLAANLSSALFPALSHLRSDPKAQVEAALRAAKLMALIVIPLAMMQAAVIEPAVHLLFRSKWDAAIPLMQILSVALGFDAIAWIASTLLVAQRGFWRQFGYLAAFVPPFFVLAGIGGGLGSALGVAIGVCAYYVLVTPIYSYTVFRTSNVGVWRLAKLYLLPAVVGGAAAAGGLATCRLLHVDGNLPRIALTLAAGGAYFLALLSLADRESLHDLRDLAFRVAGRRLRPPAAA